MFSVVRQARIPAPVSHSWDYITQPALIREWFADVDSLETGRFSLQFGDGDFFVATIKEWQEPKLLRLEWQFMGIGPQFEISFGLTPITEFETELTVTDYGALTPEEAKSLNEGWEDFLNRLVNFVRTKKSTRFRWSEIISVAAILKGLNANAIREMRDQEWWRGLFPDARLRFKEHGELFEINFDSESWNGITTEASLRTKQFDFGAYLAVSHSGWTNLPEAQQVSERCRYAGLWQGALQALENRYRTL